MTAVPQFQPDDAELGNESSNPAPSRTATVLVDELGITIKADLRIRGVVKEVAQLFAVTPSEEHADLLAKVIVIGATTAVTAAEITATDAARVKLVQAADAMIAAQEHIFEKQGERDKALGEKIEAAVRALTAQVDTSSKQELQLRRQLKEGQDEVTKAAKALDTSRGELEKKATDAISKLTEAQTKAKDEMTKATETSLRKLVDKNDPTSAPALIGEAMGKVAAEMREATSKNLGELEKEFKKQFGTESPLIERLAKTVREGAEAEIKRVEEQVAKLREDLLQQRTREAYSPHLVGDSYEDDLLELLGHGAAVYGWTVDRTGTETGDSAGSKKGDHLVVDENNIKVAAIEARARKNVSARAFYEGLADTAQNRGVKVVVYCARSADDLPSGIGAFSRGLVPFHYRLLSDGVHAFATVIDPTSEAVAERLAMILWLVEKSHAELPTRRSQTDAIERIAQALPWVQQITTRLSSFRMLKSGLTKADGEISRVMANVAELEAKLKDDLENLEQALWGDEDAALQAA